LNLILNLYKAPIEKYYKKSTLTYESLHTVLAPYKTLNEVKNGYTIQEVFNFFRIWKIALYVLDINMNIIDYFEPETRNRNITSSPRVVYVVFHDKHIYQLNHNLKSFEQKVKSKIESREEICKTPNNKYYLKEKNEDTDTKMINSYDELIEVFESYDAGTEGKKEINILYNQPSVFDLWVKFYNNGLNPNVLMTKGTVCFKHMTMNWNNNTFIISTLEEEGVYSHSQFDTEAVFHHYSNRKNYVYNNLLTRNYVSSYSQNVKAMLNAYMTTPLIGLFNTGNSEISGKKLDFNKYYTSILMNIKKIPMVNAFDEFRDYLGEPIEDYDIYFVKKLNNNYTYPIQKHSLCFGMNIKQVNDIQIISVLEISKLRTNVAGDVVKNIYADEKLNPTLRKNLINHIVGNYNKKENKKYYTSVSKYRNEAEYILAEYGGKIIPQYIDAETTVYINYIENGSEIDDGFRLISLLVYDIAHKTLFDLKTRVESCGLEVYSCNTDCLDIEDDKVKLKTFKEKYPQYFNYSDRNSFNGIGKLKISDVIIGGASRTFEKDKYGNFEGIKQIFNENIYSIIPKADVHLNNIELVDEFDRLELDEKIMAHDRLIIKADRVAGAGKTSALIHNSIQSKERTIIITPYNALCLKIRNDARELVKSGVIEEGLITSITLHKLIGMTFDGATEAHSNRKQHDITGIVRIVFDEIYLHNTNYLSKISDYMNKHPEIKFNATGDEYQNNPIDDLCVANPKEYYNKIVLSLFPNYITLKENKRCQSADDRVKIKSMTHEILATDNKKQIIQIFKDYGVNLITKPEDIITKRNICGTNASSNWVNNLIYKKYHGEKKYFVGQELICRKTINSAHYRTFVNYTYTVMNIATDTFTLDDGEIEFDIPVAIIHQHFNLPYAQTCHSAQGMGIEEAITIFDLDEWFVDNSWVYTAITRVVSLDNLNIYVGSIGDNKMDRIRQIDGMIRGHMEADKNREIVGEYITIEWVQEKLKKTKTCKYCKNHLDTSGSQCFSIDRIDNNIAHTESNCQIICLKCNVSKK
jgi:hypothetical protein